jgi:outer membrane protein assembly factor BamB
LNFVDFFSYGDLSFAKYSIYNHGSFSEDILIVGSNGYIVNLNPENGKIKLKTNLKYTGYHAVSLLVDQESHLLFVVTSGRAYAFQPENHQEVWKNEMKGMGTLPGNIFFKLNFKLNFQDKGCKNR